MKAYFWNLLLSLDQFANSLFGGNPDMTVSERLRRARNRGSKWGKFGCGILDRLDPDHCEKSKDKEVP